MGSSALTLFGGTFVAVLVAGFYIQKALPPPPPKLVGIDLGTTYSCIGAYQSISGNVIIFEDENHHKCIPSIVAFSEDKILVGYEALDQLESNSVNTIYDAKRFIGKTFSQSELDQESNRYQFKMTLDSERFVRFNIKYKGEQIQVSPEEIGGHVISKLKQNAERNITSPKMAVISVPAEFDKQQRNFTKRAAQLAGYKIERVINEPTSAALAYGLHKRSEVQNVLVVDLGGGTLDVSLLAIQGGMFLSRAMAGNNHLGGQDFNRNLQKYIISQIESKYQIKFTDKHDLQVVRTAVESAKINLTSNLSTEISLTLNSIIVHGQPAIFKTIITRAEFEKINDVLFQKVLEPIEAVIKYANIAKQEVDEIVMVGGSTRIPRVRSIISEYFGGKKLNTEVDADLAVVSGTSIQAGIIGGMWPLTVSAIEMSTSVKKIHLK